MGGTWELTIKNESLEVCPAPKIGEEREDGRRRGLKHRRVVIKAITNGALAFPADDDSHTQPRMLLGPAGA